MPAPERSFRFPRRGRPESAGLRHVGEKMRPRHCASPGRNDRGQYPDQSRSAELTGYSGPDRFKYPCCIVLSNQQHLAREQHIATCLSCDQTIEIHTTRHRAAIVIGAIPGDRMPARGQRRRPQQRFDLATEPVERYTVSW